MPMMEDERNYSHASPRGRDAAAAAAGDDDDDDDGSLSRTMKTIDSTKKVNKSLARPPSRAFPRDDDSDSDSAHSQNSSSSDDDGDEQGLQILKGSKRTTFSCGKQPHLRTLIKEPRKMEEFKALLDPGNDHNDPDDPERLVLWRDGRVNCSCQNCSSPTPLDCYCAILTDGKKTAPGLLQITIKNDPAKLKEEVLDVPSDVDISSFYAATKERYELEQFELKNKKKAMRRDFKKGLRYWTCSLGSVKLGNPPEVKWAKQFFLNKKKNRTGVSALGRCTDEMLDVLEAEKVIKVRKSVTDEVIKIRSAKQIKSSRGRRKEGHSTLVSVALNGGQGINEYMNEAA